MSGGEDAWQAFVHDEAVYQGFAKNSRQRKCPKRATNSGLGKRRSLIYPCAICAIVYMPNRFECGSGRSKLMELEIGKVIHYYNHLSVAVLELVEELKLGDKVRFVGISTDFVQRVTSMEVEHHPVLWVKAGDHMAIKVVQPVHVHDVVYRVVTEETEPIA